VIRVFFDENFGRPTVQSLEGLLKNSLNPPAEIAHILDFYEQGTPDNQWLPKLAEEGWIVISADRAKRSGGPKLPYLCAQFGITHILLSGRIHKQPQFEKAVSVASVWNEIVAASSAPKGSRYILRLSSGANPRPVLVRAVMGDEGK
jgi:hypothetical protein